MRKDTMERSDDEKVKEMDEVTVDNLMEERWLKAMVHDGVRCVECNISPIKGKRFSCDECYDYNLCEECWTTERKKLQRSFSKPASWTSTQTPPFNRSHTLNLPSTQISLQTTPFNNIPQKQEHKQEHSFTNVLEADTDWARALRLNKGLVFRTIIGDKKDRKLAALHWVMNKEKSTQKTASYLLDMKMDNDKDNFITDFDIIQLDGKMKDNTVLIKALRNSWEDVALSLIKRFDIYVKDRKKMTTLMWACKTNLPSVVEKLLERNTKGENFINQKNQEKMTALAIAVANKNDDCIKHILCSGVTVDMYCHIKNKLLPFSYKNINDFLDSQIDKVKPHWGASG